MLHIEYELDKPLIDRLHLSRLRHYEEYMAWVARLYYQATARQSETRLSWYERAPWHGKRKSDLKWPVSHEVQRLWLVWNLGLLDHHWQIRPDSRTSTKGQGPANLEQFLVRSIKIESDRSDNYCPRWAATSYLIRRRCHLCREKNDQDRV